MRCGHTAIMTMAAAFCAGCVLDIKIEAGFDDAGKLEFRSEQQGDDHWCLDHFKVVDRQTRQVMWEVDTDWGQDKRERRQMCDDDFPLTYGATPRWLVERVRARSLRSGRTYDIIGHSGNLLSGVFRYSIRRVVTNTGDEPLWD